MTEYAPAKTGEYPSNILQFSKLRVLRKYFKVYKHNSPHLVLKYARIFVLEHYLFQEKKRTVKIDEQIMSKDKYASIFSRQVEAIVFIFLQIFFATRAVLKIGKYSWIFPSFSWGIFGHVTRLDRKSVV